MRHDEWIEHGQRFRYVGSQICTTKPAGIRLAYGDQRLEQLRAERERKRARRRTRIGRLLSRLWTKRPAA